MPLPPPDEMVLNALRAHADVQTVHVNEGSDLGKVILSDAHRDLTVNEMKAETFYNIIKSLTGRRLYKGIDEEHGWVVGPFPWSKGNGN